MVRLSKKVEYGLIAIRHVATKERGDLVTAKEISDAYGIPFELLAKVLQRLTKAGLILSTQGVHGGYALARPAEEIAVSTIINAIEGTRPVIARCLSEGPQSCGPSPAGLSRSPSTRKFP